MLNEILGELLGHLSPFYTFGAMIWNLVISMCGGLAAQTPGSYSAEAWGFVGKVLYPWATAIGVSFLNLSYCIGFFRQMGNLKQNFTLEVFVESCLKLISGNALIVMGIPLMSTIFRMAGGMAAGLMMEEQPYLPLTPEADAGVAMFYLMFGIIFFIVSLVCSGMIFLTIYGRFLQLYLLVCTMPFAVAALPGGGGMSQATYAWVRTFLAKAFEAVVIVIALCIGSRMVIGIHFGNADLGPLYGAAVGISTMFTMVVLTATVKGTDAFMRRAFAL